MYKWTLLLTFLFASAVNASSITERRIYLDKEKNTVKFRISNNSEYDEECKLVLSHHFYNDDATKIIPFTNGIPEDSASPLIRYSPRTFSLPVNTEQYISFRMRRLLSEEAKEYRSYMTIDCIANRSRTKDGQLEVAMTPRLLHQIPLIVRTGSIPAQVAFTNIKVVDKQLSFDIERSGDRSVYGDIKLINSLTNVEIKRLSNVAMYPETSHRKMSFKLPSNININNLKLAFTEIKAYGGSIDSELALTGGN